MERIIGENQKTVKKPLWKEESQPSLTKWSRERSTLGELGTFTISPGVSWNPCCVKGVDLYCLPHRKVTYIFFLPFPLDISGNELGTRKKSLTAETSTPVLPLLYPQWKTMSQGALSPFHGWLAQFTLVQRALHIARSAHHHVPTKRPSTTSSATDLCISFYPIPYPNPKVSSIYDLQEKVTASSMRK